MRRDIRDLPERMGLLRDATATEHLTLAVLRGHELPPLVTLVRAADAIEDDAARWGVLGIRDLVDEAMRRFDKEARTQADAWLAPRLHATLRMTRAEAADPRIWNFLALVVAPDYVVWRHMAKGRNGEPDAVPVPRFRGPQYSQAFSRLWWAAELFRDGADYTPAVIACGNQDVLHSALRLDIVHHRPTACAIARLVSEGTTGQGREVNALLKAVNAAGSTLLYEVLAPDPGPDAEALRHWSAEAESAPPVPRETLPEGPDDGAVPQVSVETLVKQFVGLFADAPVRGREDAGHRPS
ncbi:DUF6339 family protein [Streptomyces sp. MS19]|uniref:DUF6339 family protein n=1 Tax=Streptomyces sp. MS19 TaxID=3385972 RepID=UPI0039A3B834